ncbi:MAG: S41 family peptidase [Chloroflexota bacterium]|nr:S41 family peptidase [Chloroflexota bacterium]
MVDPRMKRQIPTARGWTILLVVSLILLVVVVSFGGGLVAERWLFQGAAPFDQTSGGRSDAASDPYDPRLAFPRLTEVKHLLEHEYFYRPAAPDAAATFVAKLDRDAIAGMTVAAATPAASLAEYRRELEYAGIHGMTSGLEDAYTVFLEPALQAPLAEDLRGEYEGIGVVVNQPEGRFTIISVYPGSPAEAAGLQANDVILEADDTPLTDLETARALEVIRGPAGTRVRLVIEREGEAAPFAVEVERQAIVTQSVIYEPVADGRLGWIRVGIFGDKTTGQLDVALRQAEEDDVAGIVLDLRANGGGWVVSAQEVIGRFVPADRGPALYEDRRPGDDDPLEALSILNGGPTRFDLPLVVLIDGGTASAAEIVAGALREYGRARLVGLPTFGKGSVQRVHDFADGSSARVTSAQWLTPDQAPIPGDGLQPDVTVALAEGEDEHDEQLDRAIETLLDSATRQHPAQQSVLLTFPV